MKLSFWYVLGMITFGFLIGFLVGASNTPVVGAVIAGLIPVITTLITLFNKKKNRDEGTEPPNIKVPISFIGATISLLSIFIIVGLFSGEYHRRFDALAKFKKDKEIPLSDVPIGIVKKDTIKTFEQALFLINTYEYLSNLNYSDDEIKSFLAMDLKIDVKSNSKNRSNTTSGGPKPPPSGLKQKNKPPGLMSERQRLKLIEEILDLDNDPEDF